MKRCLLWAKKSAIIKARIRLRRVCYKSLVLIVCVICLLLRLGLLVLVLVLFLWV